ncbi:MAG: hypothetical protein AcusKO_13510 [Acuticoccus sp.]
MTKITAARSQERVRAAAGPAARPAVGRMMWRVSRMFDLTAYSGSLAVLTVCSLAMGVVFDKWEVGRWRSAMIGCVAGAALVGLFAVSGVAMGAGAAGGGALLLMAGLLGGAIAVATALVLPLSLCVEVGGAAAAPMALLLVGAGLLGVGANGLCRSRRWSLHRPCILMLAALSPISLLAPMLFFPRALADGRAHAAIAMVELMVATALFGLLTFNERARAHAERQDCREDDVDADTALVNAELFDSQLRHHFELHNRYGVQFGYLVVGIDQKGALRQSLPAAAWQRVRADVAGHVRAAVRDCDICSAQGTSETGVLLPYIGRAQMRSVAARIRDAIAVATLPCQAEISVSVGMAHVSEANGVDELRVLADNALSVARTARQRGAIGPPQTAAEEQPVVLRSFPGLVVVQSDDPSLAVTAANRRALAHSRHDLHDLAA